MVFFHIVQPLHHLLLASLDEKAWWEGMEMLEIFMHRTVAVVHFTDHNEIHKSLYCIRCIMVCKIGFTNWNAKIALSRAPMVVTYCIKLFQTEANRNNGILLYLLLLVAETIKFVLKNQILYFYKSFRSEWLESLKESY